MGLCTVAYSGAIVVTGTGDISRMLENVSWRLKRHSVADVIEAAKYREDPIITKKEWNRNSRDGRRLFK